ncbi:helix-hairpin-helix domain-containing protein [Bernardetia sp. ABR2-2B]|uniref:helix-hairpin-helix domain-containing protein n=1 Tax=Bernardetia sp. ABR2-2B TaxID=3127472 RepID=UPI0030CB077C
MNLIQNIRAEFSELVKNNSNFSQREANGMVVLSIVFVFPILAIIYERVQSIDEIDAELTALQVEKADSLLAVLEMQQPLDRETKLAMLEIPLFNPNKLSIAQWQAMGVRPWVAKRVVNAVNKKYVFLQKNDLERFNGFPKEEYERLKDYIDLPDSVDRKAYYKNKYASQNKYKKKKYDKNKYKNYGKDNSENKYTSTYEKKEYKKYVPKVIEKFDINTTDTATLKQIRGIGEKTALQIENFRNRIGGFHSLEQAKDVYILSPEAYEELKKYALIISPIKKININKADYQTLKNHLYIKGKSASILLKYKKQHGNYKNIEDIKKSRAIKEENLTKLIPYLEF